MVLVTREDAVGAEVGMNVAAEGVFSRVYVVAELVGGEPELGLEADGGG